MRSFLRLTTLVASCLLTVWALPGCSDNEGTGGKMEGGAMPSGKMEGGAMPSGKMEGGAMPPGKMEGGAMPPGKMEGGAMNKMDGAMDKGKMDGAMDKGRMEVPPK
jgi:hypothetical protein